MRLRLLARQFYPATTQPLPDCLEILGSKTVEIASAYGDESAAVLHEAGQRLGIGNQDALANLIGQPHESGKLLPGKRHPVAAKLDLIRPQLAVAGQVR